jgi:hypothetical protein
VVRKEIIRLLDVGIIYHVVESDSISHVPSVPKKRGGFSVVPNEHNELVPTHTIGEHRIVLIFES